MPRSCRLHRRGTEQIAQADQVVGDHVQAEHRSDLFGAAQLELTQPAPLLDPAKHLLNPAAGVDRLGVALVAGGAAINGRATRSVGVLGHVGRDPDPPQFGGHALGVVVLVGTQGFLVGTGECPVSTTLAARVYYVGGWSALLPLPWQGEATSKTEPPTGRRTDTSWLLVSDPGDSHGVLWL